MGMGAVELLSDGWRDIPCCFAGGGARRGPGEPGEKMKYKNTDRGDLQNWPLPVGCVPAPWSSVGAVPTEPGTVLADL